MECIKALAFCAIVGLVAACGTRPHHGPVDVDAESKVPGQSLANLGGKQPIAEPRDKSHVTPPPIVGTYQQDLNAAVKLVVYTDMLIDTNLTVPLDPASGSRLKPQLPHRLKWDDTNNYFTTDTYFNLPGGTMKNAEFRVDAYDDGNTLDVTIIAMLPKSPFTATGTGNTTTPCGNVDVTKSVNSTSSPQQPAQLRETAANAGKAVAFNEEDNDNSGGANLCDTHHYNRPQTPYSNLSCKGGQPNGQPGQTPGQQPDQAPDQSPGQQPGGNPPPKPIPNPTPNPTPNPPAPTPTPCPKPNCPSCPNGGCTNTNTNTVTVNVNVTCPGGTATAPDEEKRFLYHFIRL